MHEEQQGAEVEVRAADEFLVGDEDISRARLESFQRLEREGLRELIVHGMDRRLRDARVGAAVRGE